MWRERYRHEVHNVAFIFSVINKIKENHMTNLLILTNGSRFVTEYIGKDIFASAPTRAIGSLTAANLYVESPYHTYASVICRQRAHWQRLNGR